MDIQLPLSDEDIEKVNQLIVDAYEAGYQAGKEDQKRFSENLQRLRDAIKRREHSFYVPYTPSVQPLGTGGGGAGTAIDINDRNDSIDHMKYRITCIGN